MIPDEIRLAAIRKAIVIELIEIERVHSKKVVCSRKRLSDLAYKVEIWLDLKDGKIEGLGDHNIMKRFMAVLNRNFEMVELGGNGVQKGMP